MTIEDQAAFEKWESADREWNCDDRMEAWQAACVYKDKRIAELEAGLKEISECDAYGYTDEGEFVARVALRALEGGGDFCEWKETDEAPYPRQSYRSACGYQHVQVSGIREMSGQGDKMILTATDCPKCHKPIHISE